VNDFLAIANPNEDSLLREQPEDVLPILLDIAAEDAPPDSTLSGVDSDTDSGTDPDTADHLAENLEPPKKRVFISHKRDVAINDEIGTRLKRDLEPFCESVYLDLEDNVPSEDYVAAIIERLSNADFFIVFISEAGNRSAWIHTELDYANFYFNQKGSPRIIPVRLGFQGLYYPSINGFLRDAQAISIDSIDDNYEEKLLKPLTGLITKPIIPSKRFDGRLTGFVVNESRQKRVKAGFVEPSSLAGIRDELRDRKLLWVVGEAGVRNYLGLALAVDSGRERIYEISKPRSWSEVNSSVVSDAAIVFQDSTPAAYFEETAPKAELDSLRSLVERTNAVIVTISEEGFQEVEQEMLKQAFEYSASTRVNSATFCLEEKLTIFRGLLELALEMDSVHPKHYNWALKMLDEPTSIHEPQHRLRVENRDKFLEIIRKCTPADIDQFFTQSLREVRQPSDFIALLQQNAGGDEEVHSWFLSLDDSTKCFVITVALCSELSRPLFWKYYKTIVQDLRSLDPHLALLPIGVGRYQAKPYVTAEGPLDFVPRLANAVNNEIATNYREYLVELLPRLKDWSVPSGRTTDADRNSEGRKRKANKTQPLRAAVARLVGTAAKEDLDSDIAGIIEHWATDPILRIRDAVAIALEQSAQETDSANRALDLLKGWGSGSTNDEQSFLKLYATALPLTRFASSNSGQAVYQRALDYLKFLARDRRRSVQFYTSIAVKKMARKAQSADLETLLSSLAQDNHVATRVNAAQALNQARFHNDSEVSALIQRWLVSDDANLRWVAICSLLSSGNQARARNLEEIQRQVREIEGLLLQDAGTVASVFLELINDDRLKKNAWRLFRQLLMEESNGDRQLLIAGLAKTDFNQLDKKLLDRLRRYGDPQHERLIIEIRRAYWENLLLSSGSLLTDLRKRLGEEKRIVEMFQTLTEMLRPEPEGARQEVVGALVAFYPQDREILNEVLLKLQRMAPSIFGPVSAEIRRAALSRLFYDPPTLVQTLVSDLENPETSQETYAALESMAQSEPLGQRKELLQAFAYAYAVNPASARPFLRLLRSGSSRVLPLLSYEFTYNVLEGKLDTPREFVATILNGLQDESEQEEVLNVLQRFAMPEPNGKKRRLVNSLSSAKEIDPSAVDMLLQNNLLRNRVGLSRLEFDVRVASILNSVFVPRFVSRWFRPR